MLEQYLHIENLKQSQATFFLAEVFFDEIQYMLDVDLTDSLIVQNHGMNSRVSSKDILDVTTHYISTHNDYKEFVVLHLARNGIYHQLPEILFYPLVISSPSMSNREVVEAMRFNRKKERKNLNFFVPFDTALFKERVKINNRHLNFFSGSDSKRNFSHIINRILAVNLHISEHQYYQLFLHICNVKHLKENLPELQQLLKIVLDLKITLKYVPHVITELPYDAIGVGQLGVSLGLSGDFNSEVDDIEASIFFDQQINDYMHIKKIVSTVKGILSFFVLSTRDVIVSYTMSSDNNFDLGSTFLGYDTSL